MLSSLPSYWSRGRGGEKWGSAAANLSRSVWLMQTDRMWRFQSSPPPPPPPPHHTHVQPKCGLSALTYTMHMVGWECNYSEAAGHLSLCVLPISTSQCSISLHRGRVCSHHRGPSSHIRMKFKKCFCVLCLILSTPMLFFMSVVIPISESVAHRAPLSCWDISTAMVELSTRRKACHPGQFAQVFISRKLLYISGLYNSWVQAALSKVLSSNVRLLKSR